MNTLVVEGYNLFPYASFPACADAGHALAGGLPRALSPRRAWHVTLVPSLQTLAQAYELVWTSAAGAPYREATAPGLICPSNPDVYPFIKGLYRDLLTWFADAPLIGIGCSEIDMQWQGALLPEVQGARREGRDRARPAARPRRDVHPGGARTRRTRWAARCGRSCGATSSTCTARAATGWASSASRAARSWASGSTGRTTRASAGLMDRGYDVLGISAMYNHCFYLADLSPADPPKSWPSMEADRGHQHRGSGRATPTARGARIRTASSWVSPRHRSRNTGSAPSTPSG